MMTTRENATPLSVLERRAADLSLAVSEGSAPRDDDFAARVGQLPRLLRLVGAVLVISSAATFVVNRWQSENDIWRYFSLLALTAAVAATGLLCALRLREGKSARLLLSLGLAVVPMHFCVLGALLYSRLALDSVVVTMPSWANWTAPGLASALLTTAAGLAVLVPFVVLSFKALARPSAAALSVQFLLSGALLLLPVRHPDIIGPLLLCMAVLAIAKELRVHRANPALHTPEGRFARIALALPAAFVAGRSLHFYAGTDLFMAALCFAAAAVLFLLAPRDPESRPARTMQVLSTLPAFLGWVFVANLATYQLCVSPRLCPQPLPLVGLGFAATLVAMSARCIGSAWGYRSAAALAALVPLCLNLVLSPSVVSTVLCLAAAVCALAYAQMRREWTTAALAGATLLFSLGQQIQYAVDVYSVGRWGSLALIGVAAIIGGSWIERNHERLTRARDQR